jgi:hypothetical protein
MAGGKLTTVWGWQMTIKQRWAVCGAVCLVLWLVSLTSLAGPAKTPADKEAIAAMEKLVDVSAPLSSTQHSPSISVSLHDYVTAYAEAAVKVKALDSENQPEFKAKINESLKMYQNALILWGAQPNPSTPYINCNPSFDRPEWPYNQGICNLFSEQVQTGHIQGEKFADIKWPQIDVAVWRGEWVDKGKDFLEDAVRKVTN